MLFHVSRLLKSAARFHQPMNVGGIELSHPSRAGGVLIATGSAEADDFQDAVRDVDARILTAMDAISAARLVAVSSYGAPTLTVKDGTNLARLQYSVPDEDQLLLLVGHHEIDADIQSAYSVFSVRSDLGGAARHYREAMLAGNVLAIALHLLRAAEALSPTKREGELKTDYSALSKLLGFEMYSYFYGSGRVRNDLMHGRLVDQDELQPRLRPLRTAIEQALGKRADLVAQPTFEPRGFHSHRKFRYWLELGPGEPDLPALVAMGTRDELSTGSGSIPRVLLGPEELDTMREFGVDV